MSLDNPIGEIIQWKPEWREHGTYTVIGVVKDMVKGSPFEPTHPSIIFLSDKDLDWLYIRINPHRSAGEAIPRIQKAFNEIIPSAPFDFVFTDDAFDNKFRSEERVGKLAGIFSVLAILISCSGLFGLASFMAERKTKEISIRKVLGASVSQLWRLLSTEYVILVLLSCLIAIPISSYFMKMWLDQYSYRITIGMPVYVFATLGAFAITVLTVSAQAIRTALKNPVDNLKCD